MSAAITHAFVGFRRCGGALFVEVDDPNERPQMSRAEIIDLLRAGGRVERVTLEVARATPMCFGCCERCK